MPVLQQTLYALQSNLKAFSPFVKANNIIPQNTYNPFLVK